MSSCQLHHWACFRSGLPSLCRDQVQVIWVGNVGVEAWKSLKSEQFIKKRGHFQFGGFTTMGYRIYNDLRRLPEVRWKRPFMRNSPSKSSMELYFRHLECERISIKSCLFEVSFKNFHIMRIFTSMSGRRVEGKLLLSNDNSRTGYDVCMTSTVVLSKALFVR